MTDFYLADLAAKHGMKLATFDAGIKHAGAELVSRNAPGQAGEQPLKKDRR